MAVPGGMGRPCHLAGHGSTAVPGGTGLAGFARLLLFFIFSPVFDPFSLLFIALARLDLLPTKVNKTSKILKIRLLDELKSGERGM